MADNNEAISVRATRLNNIILGSPGSTSKTTKSVADALSRESLLDAITLLHNECNKDFLKKKDKHIKQFVTKFDPIMKETKKLRVSINDFNVKCLINKGFFGNVHLVAEKATGDIYAMKKMKKTVVSASQIKEERDIMASRASPWLTTLQYAFQDIDNLYLIMEYLPGGDLLSLMIRNGPFDEDLTKFYLAEITQSLHALHTFGYVHRDIKPENILLDRFGHLKLADFGNAAHLKNGQVVCVSPVGTPDYIAPELLETLSVAKSTETVHDETCDFWSMGIIGYELVAESTPFHDDNVHETYSKILAFGEDRHTKGRIKYPVSFNVTSVFRDLIDCLVTRADKRLRYQQIVDHPFFDGIEWNSLRKRVPPIIPLLSSDDDISNFEDIEKNTRRSTFVKSGANTLTRGNDFSGQDLPFLGYGYVYQELKSPRFVPTESGLAKQDSKVTDLQTVVKSQSNEIQNIQEKLLLAQKKNAQSDSLDKILKETQDELVNIKEKLKEQTIELAENKTKVRKLQSNLKIEEEMRLKQEVSVTEILKGTVAKWKRAKESSDENYEKQILEKNTEINHLNVKIRQQEEELKERIKECTHLQETVQKYKDMLKATKDQMGTEKNKIDEERKKMITSHEQKVADLREKLKKEREERTRLSDTISKQTEQLNESIYSSERYSKANVAADKNLENITHHLHQQIEDNRELHEVNVSLEKDCLDLQEKLKEVQCQLECLQKITSPEKVFRVRTSDLDSELSLPFKSASNSWENVSSACGSAIEEQLRCDLIKAQENENIQKERADRLEQCVKKLEDMVERVNEKPAHQFLEKKNEKLEDQLAAAREEAIVERQASRAAHLSVWRLEKQIDELNSEKKLLARRIEAAEEKFRKAREEKDEIERKLKNSASEMVTKESRMSELQEEIRKLQADVKKERSMWQDGERIRMKEKSEMIEYVSKVSRLEENLDESKRNVSALQDRCNRLTTENERLGNELEQQIENYNHCVDTGNELENELKTVQNNYKMLQEACKIMEIQLTELEEMLDKERKRNGESNDKITENWNKLHEKDEEIVKLRQEINQEKSLKILAETKSKQLQHDWDEIKKQSEEQYDQMVNQQKDLIMKTSALHEAQMRIELLSSDSSELERVNTNVDRQLTILKEENTKYLTELYLSKENANKLQRQLTDMERECGDLRNEIDHLNGTLSEQKNYYIHRDIKSEATLNQQKKLIDYLQAKVEEYSHKKKKSLAEVIFGVSGNKKENIPPNDVQNSIRRLQDQLKNEKDRTQKLTEQLLQSKTEMRSQKAEKNITVERDSIDSVRIEDAQNTVSVNTLARSNSTPTSHRFEMTLETTEGYCTECFVCKKMILSGLTYWRCKECNKVVHRKCRNEVTSLCGADDQNSNKSISLAGEAANESINKNDSTCDDYSGTVIFNPTELSLSLCVSTAFEVCDNTLLLGCASGLYSFNLLSKHVVHISGITAVNHIAVHNTLSKAVIIGSDGEHLYQCDLRHLQNRGRASACLKPKLETILLDLPFANRAPNERWCTAKMSSESNHLAEAILIAATTFRIVIFRFDVENQKFKPVRALDTVVQVSSILFTRHTAIIAADKFFEVDLASYAIEEFLDMSDQSLKTHNSKPMNIFRVNKQEFLLCFAEFGVFVDEYGCRSRPENLNWINVPTGFMYRDPLLFISHDEMVQVVRVTKSYTKEMQLSDEERHVLRSFVNVEKPLMVAECGKLGVYALTKHRSGAINVISVDGLETLKNVSNSLETLSSSISSFPLETATSCNTLSSNE